MNGAEFLHIPKTGGTWVEAALRANGLVRESLGHKHTDYEHNLFGSTFGRRHYVKTAARMTVGAAGGMLFGGSEPRESDVYRFCIVRHPLSWYESWWRYMQKRGWHDWGKVNSRQHWHPNAPLNGLGSTDFNQFVWNVVRERPGYVTELFFSFTKPGISFIGKLETLRDDLMAVLSDLELPYEPSTIQASPKLNATLEGYRKLEWDPELKNLVQRLELPALLHFDYLTPEEMDALGVTTKLPPHPAIGARRPRTEAGAVRDAGSQSAVERPDSREVR